MSSRRISRFVTLTVYLDVPYSIVLDINATKQLEVEYIDPDLTVGERSFTIIGRILVTITWTAPYSSQTSFIYVAMLEQSLNSAARITPCAATSLVASRVFLCKSYLTLLFVTRTYCDSMVFHGGARGRGARGEAGTGEHSGARMKANQGARHPFWSVSFNYQQRFRTSGIRLCLFE